MLGLTADTDATYERARAHAGIAAAQLRDGDRELARHHWRRALALYTDLGVPAADEIRARLSALDRATADPPD